MRRFDRPVTYEDYYRTGLQDCSYSLDLPLLDISAGSADQIVEAALEGWELDGLYESWLSQQDKRDLRGLHPYEAYRNWRSGFKACAIRYVERMKDRPTENPRKQWWQRKSPKPRLCYASKSDALRAFLDVNDAIVQGYGGMDYQVSPSEFDAINHKYALKGKRAVRTIADAVWIAMPQGKPYCLDRLDLDVLNDTSPAREAGAQFRLPDEAYLEMRLAEEAKRAEEAQEAAADGLSVEEDLPSWVTDESVYEGEVEPGMELEPVEPLDLGFDPSAMPEPEATPVKSPALPSMEDLVLVPPSSEEQYLEAYVVPSKLVVKKREPWMDNLMYVTKERRPLSLGATANPACECEGLDVTMNPRQKRSEYGPVKLTESPNDYAVIALDPASGVGQDGDTVRNLRDAIAWARQIAAGSGVFRGGSLVAMSAIVIANYDDRHVTVYSVSPPGYPVWREEKKGREPHDNPSAGWVAKVIANNYSDMEGEVPDKWLPKVSSMRSSGGRKVTATMQEYGCGNYGCVLPTHDPKVVLKLTTDQTEAEFATALADKLSARVVVKYHKAVSVPEKHKGSETYLLWRDAADRVGELLDVVKERGGDQRAAHAAIKKQHDLADKAYDALAAGKDASALLTKWKAATREMAAKIPELAPLAKGMITVLDKDGILFGDVHDGNIGLVNGRWTIIDPGNIAVISEEA